MKKFLLAFSLISTIMLCGCTDISDSETEFGSNFELLISDARADIEDFDSAIVTLSKIRIFPNENNNDTFEEFSLNSTQFDLTQLIGNKSLSVLNITLEIGNYSKLELHVSDINATINSTEADVTVPSGKLQITISFEIKANETTSFVFDINIVKKGQTNEYNLLPVISDSGVIGQHLEEEHIERVRCTVRGDCTEGQTCIQGDCVDTS